MTGRVTSDAGVPLAGASVFIAGMNLGTQTNENGSYTFVVPANVVYTISEPTHDAQLLDVTLPA